MIFLILYQNVLASTPMLTKKPIIKLIIALPLPGSRYAKAGPVVKVKIKNIIVNFILIFYFNIKEKQVQYQLNLK